MTLEQSITKFNQFISDKRVDMSNHQSEYEITNLLSDSLMCCCWMPIHYDEYYLDATGCYTINCVWCVHNATLVHRSKGKVVSTKLKVGERIVFRACNQHCLVPNEIAEQCENHNSFQAAKRFFDKLERDRPQLLPTAAVWEFIQ